MENKFEHEVFNRVYEMFPVLSELYDHNVCIGIADWERYLYVVQGKEFKIPFHTGDKTNAPLIKVLESGRITKLSMPKTMVETDNTCYFFPLREDGKVVGALTVAVDQSYRNELMNITDVLSGVMTGISENVKEASEGFKNLSMENENLLQATHSAAEQGKDSKQIVSMIRSISSKTNLLGLNASIEAARAGEAGRGFAVVAGEISKLSKTSKDSIEKIDGIINDISEQIIGIDDGLSVINEVSKKQAEALEGIVAAVREIDETVKKIRELVKKL